MLNRQNLPQLLEALSFTKTGEHDYTKFYTNVRCSIKVDLKNKLIHYPEEDGLRIERKTISNFSHNESFVVLECVDRLLTKGYRPKSIELEKKWSLGHRLTGGEDSGFADICVYAASQEDQQDQLLFIIECKTFGEEYEKELRNLRWDGGQLFSYWQQERGCQYLVLYTSDIKDGKVEYSTETVDCHDDPNNLKLAESDPSLRLYLGARTVDELYEVWSQTYEQRLVGDVVFHEDARAYKLDIKPLRKKDLRDFSENDRIVNKFEEIMRHNNVSDKENAFNRLIALFICKLVDEIQKGEEDEVEFQYKVGTDTYETLQDRLQRLHKEGMEKFMREQIFYVPDSYAEDVVAQYSAPNRNNLIEELKHTLRILKFYTNNDFAFKDVHNEELFYQNGKIIVEMVQLFEEYRIIGSKDVQTLGDLFEQLLNKGFKQNEGQFFTPIPITRFIWDSLPLTTIVQHQRGVEHPKFIDYACGAGHFLTQGIEAVNAAVERVAPGKSGGNLWAASKVFGVEKDYRLARVSKISLFMHGAGNANIVFGDGLENYAEKGVEPGTFDILVANPPYAVRAFKTHLKLKDNAFTILPAITNEGSEIETLFVERIAQLLKPDGVAAVILPSSILSNDSASYTAARKQLLEKFYIRAIAAFGSNTFSATGTNTVVLFLERMKEPPRRFALVADSANAIISGCMDQQWEDAQILQAYLSNVEADPDDYRAFIEESEPYAFFENRPYFKGYVAAFEQLPVVKNKRSQKSFNRWTPDQQHEWLNVRFYAWAKEREKDKLQYFAMVYQQSVLVISAPTGIREQKEFLGYDWSNRKGNEGIVITKPGGMLYDSEDRFNDDTLAGLVRSSFASAQRELPNRHEHYRYIQLADMVNFQKLDFNAAIHLKAKSRARVASKYPLKSLGDDCFSVSIGRRVLAKDVTAEGTYPVYSANVKEVFGYTDRLLFTDFEVASTLWGIDGDWMTSFVPANEPFCPTDHCGVLRVNCNFVDPYYLSIVLESVGQHHGFSRSYRASCDRIKDVKIPIPPMDIQTHIASECMEVNREYESTRLAIEGYRENIEGLFTDLEVTGGQGLRLESIARFVSERINGTLVNSDDYITTENMLKNAEGVTLFAGVVPESSVNAYRVNDILLSNIRPYLQKIWQADRDGGASTDVLVLRVTTTEYDPRFLYYQMRRKGYFDYVMEDVSGLKMPRGKKPHILGFPVIDIPLSEQINIADRASQVNAAIRELQQQLANLIEKKEQILRQYL